MKLAPAAARLGPFAVTALLAWVSLSVDSDLHWTQFWLSVILLVGSWATGLIITLRGRMLLGTVVGSLAFLLALALLRHSAGGTASAIGIVSLLPVFQTALYVRERLGLWIVLTGVAAMYLTPLLLIGAPDYPPAGYRGALLTIAVSAIVGLVTHGLVSDIRRRASESRHREGMLERVTETAQRLYGVSTNPRHEVCIALQEATESVVVGIYERDPVSRSLVVTANTGELNGTQARVGSAVEEVFESRRPLLINEELAMRVGNLEGWRAAGAPGSILYQPLLRGDEAIAVLFLGWSEQVQATTPGVVVASLLAREAASVIERADVMQRLADDALTDPLTALPNRRAWDAQLALAVRSRREPVHVVMLDIDHFKTFNDTHGHPAGDLLLQEAASAWSAEIRAEDFLARLGGEEFALLITGDERDAVSALVERLRSRMPAAQTCSAGVAVRIPGDSPAELLSRADTALYAAKSAGRNRTMFAGDRSSTRGGAEAAARA